MRPVSFILKYFSVHPFRLHWSEGRSDHGVCSHRFVLNEDDEEEDEDDLDEAAKMKHQRMKKIKTERLMKEGILFSLRGLSVESLGAAVAVPNAADEASEVREALEERKAIRADPFRQGFEHAGQVDLGRFRICFQVRTKTNRVKCSKSIKLTALFKQPSFFTALLQPEI